MGTLENWHKAHLKSHKKATEKILRQARSKARPFCDQWKTATLTLASQLVIRKRPNQAKPLFDELVSAVNKKQITFSDSDLATLFTMKGAADTDVKDYDSAHKAITEAMKIDKRQSRPRLVSEHLILLAKLFQAQSKDKELLDTQKMLVNYFLENQQIDQELYFAVSEVVKLLEKDTPDAAAQYKLDVFEKMSQIISKRPIEQRITPLPKNWSKDPVTEYLEASRQNEVASLFGNDSAGQAINLMDGKFRAGLLLMRSEIGGIIARKHPEQKVTEVKLDKKDWLEVFFLMRCHASFLCATRLALSGAIAEAYMVVRACLENAVYAYHVKKVPADKGLWFGRKNSQTKAQLKNAFQIKTITIELRTVNPSLADKIDSLYDHIIERGAHPTLDTFTDHARQGTSNTQLILLVNYLNPDLVEQLIKDILTVAEDVLTLYRFIFPDLIW